MMSAARTLPAIALFGLLTACGAFSNPLVAPVVIVVNGAIVPAGPVGSAVTVNGAVFGTDQGSGQVTFTPSGGGIPQAAIILNPIDWSDGTIVTAVPPGCTPGTYYISVTSGNGLTSNAYVFTVTPAVFVPTGLTWTASATLPNAQSGTGVASVQVQGTNYVYAVGGARAGGTPTNEVYYSTVTSGGTLGPWVSTTSLPTALAFAAVTAATQYNSSITSSNGFLYVVGGASDAAGTPVATVYRATINANGTLGSWSTNTTLPTAVRSAGAIVWYGSMFVVGGAGAGNTPSTNVYRWPVQVAGDLTPLHVGASLPARRARFGFGASGLYLYVFGGDSGSVTPNDSTPGSKQAATIFYAKLVNNTHDVIGWSTASTSLPAARSAHTAVLQSGFALVTGGLYSGGAAEEIYTAVNYSDGSVGAFTTSAGIISRNLFNHGATGYVAGDGTFHVAVVGGDDASAPATRRAESFRY